MAKKSKSVKLTPRARRKRGLRKRIWGTAEKPRLSVFKSHGHSYAQVIRDEDGVTLASASTREAEVKSLLAEVDIKKFHNDIRTLKSCAGAKAVGLIVAERAKKKGVEKVIFDRNGFLYHGRVKALADGAREGGLKF